VNWRKVLSSIGPALSSLQRARSLDRIGIDLVGLPTLLLDVAVRTEAEFGFLSRSSPLRTRRWQRYPQGISKLCIGFATNWASKRAIWIGC